MDKIRIYARKFHGFSKIYIAKLRFIRICSSQKILMRTIFFNGGIFSYLTLFRRVSSVFDKRFSRMHRISDIWRENSDFQVFFLQIIIPQQFFVFAKLFCFPMVGINISFLQINIFEKKSWWNHGQTH